MPGRRNSYGLIVAIAGTAALHLALQWYLASPVLRAPESAQTDRQGPVAPVVHPGDRLPSFVVHDLAGNARSADRIAAEHRVVVLTFWSVSCAPCRRELADLARLHERWGGAMFGVAAVHVGRTARDAIRTIVAQEKYPFDVFVDTDNLAARRLGVRAVPTTIIVVEGEVVLVREGYDPALPELVVRRIREARR